MKIEHYNNLLELFYNQYKQERSGQVFLQSLKDPNQKFTWKQTYLNILKLSDQLESLMQNHDRCLLISENRPEWMVSDLAIMLANGITVPAYTTYTERDYEYLIDDCEPSVIIVSDKTQYNKVKNIIKKKPFIKSIISFEEFQNDNEIIFIKEIF
ncbi:AMP-binding protein [Candidatus Pelagibacter sp.]|nr:AMP-binding protein [Candidatus Pelagibacter sp.]